MTIFRFSLLAICLLLPASAGAWSSMSTNSGNPLAWDPGNPETVWRLSSSFTSNDLPNSTVDSALGNGMNEWGMPGCTSFNASQGGNVNASPLDHNDANSTVGFLESTWPSEYGSTTLAVTVPQFYSDGEIFQADMFYNAVNNTWISGTPGSWTNVDLESVAVHEFGHWIGFEHNNYPNSSLNATYSGGISERTLTCDDSEGVCAKYQSSGTSCSSDRYCACNESCVGGFCGGVVGDDDDAADDDDTTSACPNGEIEDCNGVCGPEDWVGDSYCDDMTYAWPEGSNNLIDFNCSEFNFDGGDCAGSGDDDDSVGACEGDPETFAESEPNNEAPQGGASFIQAGGGDLTLTGSVTCSNDGQQYTGDYDWFAVDFPCQSDGRFLLDWSGSSYVDYFLYNNSGDQIASVSAGDFSGVPPIYTEAASGGKLFLLVVCATGETTNYQFTFDWTPFASLGDDDDDQGSDDDDQASDDDDQASDDDDDGGARRRGCACSATSYAGAAGGGLAGMLLLAFGWLRRSSVLIERNQA